MRRVFIGCLLLCLLVGCSNIDYAERERAILENNQKTKSVLNSYAKSREAGGLLEQAVRGMLITGVVSVDDEIKGLLRGKSDVLVSQLEGLLQSVLSDYGVLREDQEVSLSDIVNTSLEVHYFLDDTTGLTDQLFLYRSRNGSLKHFTVKWLGGVFVDIEEGFTD